jgi:hypothetical protein
VKAFQKKKKGKSSPFLGMQNNGTQLVQPGLNQSVGIIRPSFGTRKKKNQYKNSHGFNPNGKHGSST